MDLLTHTQEVVLDLPDLALIHGDCRQLDHLGDESVDLVVTDPPFNVGFDYGEETDDRRPPKDYLEFTQGWMAESLRVLKPGGQLYAIMPLKSAPDWLPMVAALPGVKWHIVAWNRTMSMLHQEATYLRAWEPILWLIKGERPNVFHRTFRFASDKDWLVGSSAIGESGRIRSKKKHPTPRPDWIYRNLIMRSSNPGMVILDPMVGSGTAAYVSMELGRRFVGYDLRRDYVDLAAERVSQLPTNHWAPVPETLDGFRQLELEGRWETQPLEIKGHPSWSDVALALADLSADALGEVMSLVSRLKEEPWH